MHSTIGRRFAGLLFLGLAAGCSSGTGPPGTPPPPPPPPPDANLTVQVNSNFFTPENGSITQGQTVVWTWIGSDHNVTSVLNPSFSPNSATMNAGTFHGPVTFPTAGVFRYICTVHGIVSGNQTSGMRGTITVN